MPKTCYNILFVCNGNSARSIIAEAYVNSHRLPHLRAFSAGAMPRGTVNPFALEVLRGAGIETANPRSKSWDEFLAPDAPRMDLVVNLCDETTNEDCPIWPGKPMTARWETPDPAAVHGSDSEKRATFVAAFAQIKRRADHLLHFDTDQLDNLATLSPGSQELAASM